MIPVLYLLCFLVRNCKLCIRFSLACIDAVQSKKYVLSPWSQSNNVRRLNNQSMQANEGKSFSILLPQSSHSACTAPASVTSSVLALGAEQVQLGPKCFFFRHGYFTGKLS